jgi:hypothetical protein
MSEQLTLREYIVHATQRWPILVIFCLAGSLLGWGISLLYPIFVPELRQSYMSAEYRKYQPTIIQYLSLDPASQMQTTIRTGKWRT